MGCEGDGFKVHGFRFQVSYFGVPDFGFRISSFEFWVPGIGNRNLESISIVGSRN